MKILEYLTPERVKLHLTGETKKEIIKEMAQLFVKSGELVPEDLEEFVKEINEREKLTPTGMQDGIAIPHARTPFVKKLSLALGISDTGVDFESMDDEPSRLIFMIAAPEETKREHLDLLAEISKLSYEEEVIEKIEKAIEEHNPDVILSIGQAGGRFDISIERVGINLDDFRIPDNEGNQTIDEPIFPDGENAYFVNLPVKAMVKNVQKNEIPASVSYTAGTFVCNHVLYGTLYLVNKKYKGKKAGFIHIPFLPQQVIDKKNTPSMELNTIVKGLTAAIEAIVKNDKDIKETGGTIC